MTIKTIVGLALCGFGTLLALANRMEMAELLFSSAAKSLGKTIRVQQDYNPASMMALREEAVGEDGEIPDNAPFLWKVQAGWVTPGVEMDVRIETHHALWLSVETRKGVPAVRDAVTARNRVSRA